MAKQKMKKPMIPGRRPKAAIPADAALAISNRAASNTCQVLCWCCTVALNELYGIGAGRLEDLGRELADASTKYQANLDRFGRRAADTIMRAACRDVMPSPPRLPRERMEKTGREKLAWQARCRASDEAFCLLALALRRTFNYGPLRVGRVLEETVANWRQYMEWADGGPDEDFAMEKLRYRVQQILRSEVHLVYEKGQAPKLGG